MSRRAAAARQDASVAAAAAPSPADLARETRERGRPSGATLASASVPSDPRSQRARGSRPWRAAVAGDVVLAAPVPTSVGALDVAALPKREPKRESPITEPTARGVDPGFIAPKPETLVRDDEPTVAVTTALDATLLTAPALAAPAAAPAAPPKHPLDRPLDDPSLDSDGAAFTVIPARFIFAPHHDFECEAAFAPGTPRGVLAALGADTGTVRARMRSWRCGTLHHTSGPLA